MNTYSQSGQDVFIKKILPINNGTFVDIGCWMPEELNNTLILEQLGWNGVSIDITDLSIEWLSRNTKFVQTNALTVDYDELFDNNNLPLIIDYLSVDIEGNGHRYLALKRVLESIRDFKVITVEHDIYRGYELTEAIPQRELLSKKGYVLLCSNVRLNGNPFEDWWINPKYFKEDEYLHLKCDNVEYNEILKKLKI